ncbi:NAD-dependent epimerase/dehydratase family protein [Rhodococcus sp. 24CO]|uniref:NAD-dependent epimerase/dehydratase family protein n=1 Tax=Rhodococcus sp. 24CO TaxID=3117460 RepID=UPI003D3361D2
MKIVVTGASGNVGTALLRRLRMQPNYRLTGIVRRPPPSTSDPYRAARWRACDVGAPEAPSILAEEVAGADAVVHLAWAINAPDRDPDPSRTNATGTRHVLDAVAKADVPRLVCMSSVAAYAPAPRSTLVGESWDCTGIDSIAYSRGKRLLERSLSAFARTRRGTSLAWLRPCGIVQHDAGGEFARWLLPALIPGAPLGNILPLPLWSHLRMQVVHADDVARALEVLLSDDRAEGPFNIAGGPPMEARDLARAIGGPRIPAPRSLLSLASSLAWRTGLAPLHPRWLELADRAALVSTDRAAVELGWSPAHTQASTLAEFAAGIRVGAGTASDALAPSSLRARLGEVRFGHPTYHSQT